MTKLIQCYNSFNLFFIYNYRLLRRKSVSASFYGRLFRFLFLFLKIAVCGRKSSGYVNFDKKYRETGLFYFLWRQKKIYSARLSLLCKSFIQCQKVGGSNWDTNNQHSRVVEPVPLLHTNCREYHAYPPEGRKC